MSRALLALLLLLAPAGAARAQALVADLTQHLVAITSGFTGASVTLFGAVEGPGDIVVILRGPERRTVVRRKGQVAGIWLNTDAIAFDGVPGFYQVLSDHPVEQILSQSLRQLHGIGIDTLKLVPAEAATPAVAEAFRAALVANRQAAGLFGRATGGVERLGDRLFRATLTFPASVPTGNYSIQIFLVRGGEVAAAQITPLVVAETGFEASVNDFALDQPILYGIVAVAAAAMAGWTVSLLFRNA